MGGNVRESSRRVGEWMVEDEVRWLGEKSRELLAANDAASLCTGLSPLPRLACDFRRGTTMNEKIDILRGEREAPAAGTTQSPGGCPPGDMPKTPLGQRLWEIRARLIASRDKLLSWEEVDREVSERRGREYELPHRSAAP
jgi:hypothetical protein